MTAYAEQVWTLAEESKMEGSHSSFSQKLKYMM